MTIEIPRPKDLLDKLPDFEEGTPGAKFQDRLTEIFGSADFENALNKQFAQFLVNMEEVIKGLVSSGILPPEFAEKVTQAKAQLPEDMLKPSTAAKLPSIPTTKPVQPSHSENPPTGYRVERIEGKRNPYFVYVPDNLSSQKLQAAPVTFHVHGAGATGPSELVFQQSMNSALQEATPSNNGIIIAGYGGNAPRFVNQPNFADDIDLISNKIGTNLKANAARNGLTITSHSYGFVKTNIEDIPNSLKKAFGVDKYNIIALDPVIYYKEGNEKSNGWNLLKLIESGNYGVIQILIGGLKNDQLPGAQALIKELQKRYGGTTTDNPLSYINEEMRISIGTVTRVGHNDFKKYLGSQLSEMLA